MKILNIYGQEFEHSDACLMGNQEALIALKEAIDDAIKHGKASLGKSIPLYASDGEGYELMIICSPNNLHDDEFWIRNVPKYICKWEF